MASMMGTMWNSYHLIEDLDICLNPYGKDAYGNYRIGDNTKRKKDNNPGKLVYPDPQYKVGDVNMWCLENNEIVVGRIVRVYPASDVVSGEHINRYAINVLVDGIYSNNEIYVTENMAIEGLDADTYIDTNKISSFIPLDTNSDKPNNTDFKCDIDDLKMDINDLRTDVNSLLENQYKIEGDLRVAKQPELGISVDDTVASDIKEPKERLNCMDSTVNYCVNKIDDIQTTLDAVDNKTKRASKLSKLSFLSNLLI
jgi:hypothetical protein